jgi:hypothetical protein
MYVTQSQIALSIAVPFAAPVALIGVAALRRTRDAGGFVGRPVPITGDLTRPPDRC